MTLALDASHDLYLGSRAGVAIARDGDAVAQGILTRLKLFLGESYLDVNAGTPWYQEVLTDNPNIKTAETELKKQINADSAVESILSFDLSFDRAQRSVTLTFEADTIFGPTGVLTVTV